MYCTFEEYKFAWLTKGLEANAITEDAKEGLKEIASKIPEDRKKALLTAYEHNNLRAKL